MFSRAWTQRTWLEWEPSYALVMPKIVAAVKGRKQTKTTRNEPLAFVFVMILQNEKNVGGGVVSVSSCFLINKMTPSGFEWFL